MLGIKKGQIAGLMLTFLLTSGVMANPAGGQVVGGSATIQQSPGTTTINQQSQKAVIDWRSFNIDRGELTRFNQPNSSSVALNRINPEQGASQIFGRLEANGRIILVNPAGIFFGPGSYVNVGGLIATTTNISNENFMAGKFIFNQPSSYANASVINQGTLVAAKNGMIALVGQNVRNDGSIVANLGKVVLASGESYTVDFAGNGMINFATGSQQSHAGSVTNTGSLIANGGSVLVTAQQASGVLDNVINVDGVVEAKSVYKHKGEVVISGDPDGDVVTVAANIDASGMGQNQTGGSVNITGYNILLDSPTLINVSGRNGGGTINIGGNYKGQGPLPNANAVVVAKGASLQANAITTGNGGRIIVWSDYFTNVKGNLSAMGGSQGGNGGFVETSSHGTLDANNVLVNTSAPHGKTGIWLLDPADVTISTNANSGYTNLSDTFTPDTTVAAVTVNTTTLANNLALNNTVVTTTNSGVSGGAAGTITITDPISWASGNSLTLTADSGIVINAGITIGNSSAAQLILNAAGTVTQTAAIGGSGQLIKNGVGTFVASQANTYTGGTTINAGDLVAQNSGALGPSGAINIVANGVVQSKLILDGISSLTNTSTITMTGNGNIGDVQLKTRNATVTLANPFSLIGVTSMTAESTSPSLTVNGAVTGTGSLVVRNEGAGIILQLANNGNTYAGGTNLLEGTLKPTASGALGSGAIDIGPFLFPATLDLTALSSLTNTNTISMNSLFNPATLSTSANITLSNAITLGNTNNFLNVAGNTTQLGGAITGTGSLTKTGSGVLQFNGTSNTYSGATNINAGILRANANNVFSSSSDVILLDVAGVALDLNDRANTIKSLSGGGTTGGNVTLGSGTLSVVNSTGSTYIYGGTISGTSGFTVNLTGGGIQRLTGTNSYTGTTTITNGTLQAGAANVFSSLSTVSLANTAGATLDLNNFNNSVGFLLNGGSTGGNVLLGSGTLTLAGTTNANSTYGGNITGTGGLVMNLTGGGGAGQTLNGTNTYTGTTTLLAGTLSVNSGSIGPAVGGGNILITPSASQTAVLNLPSGSLTNTAGIIMMDSSAAGSIAKLLSTPTITLPNAITLAGLNNQFSAANNLFLNGAITGLGSMTKVGGGNVQLGSASNTYSGTTTISAGGLFATGVNRLSSNSDVVLADASNTFLNLNNFSNIIKSLSGGGTTGGNVVLSSGTLSVVNSTGLTYIYGGAISGTNGNLTLNMTGGGIQRLTGTSNGYTGTTTITNGTLQAGAANAFASNSAVTLANNAGATLDLNNFNNSIASLAGGGATGGNVTLGTGAGGILTITNAVNGSNTTYAGVISGNGGLAISLTGTTTPQQVLTGNNLYTGTTTINAGSLLVQNSGALGQAGGGAINIVANGLGQSRLILDGISSLTNPNTITLTGDGGIGNVQIRTRNATVTLANPINLISLAQFTIEATSPSLTLNGAVTGTGSFAIRNVGAGIILQLTNNGNTYSGGSSIIEGTLTPTAPGALGSGAITITPSIFAGTLDLTALSSLTNTNTITLNSQFNTVNLNTSANITLSNAITLVNTNNFFNVAANTTQLGGAITGTGSFTKTGSGVLQFNGTSNTYSGGTTINAGILRANAANAFSSASAVTLLDVAGAALDLNGNNNTIKSLAGGGGTGGNVALGSGTLTIASSNTGNTSYDGVISSTGAGGLTINITGAGGSQTLTRANTYTGATTINAGTLVAGIAGALGGGAIVITPSASRTAILNLTGLSSLTNPNTISMDSSAASSAAQISTSAAITLSNAISLDGGLSNTFNVAANTTQLGGAITGGGSLTKTGAGVLQFNGTSNTYSGDTNINAGILRANAANALSSFSAITLLDVAGVALDLNGNSNSIGSLTGGGTTGGNLTLGAGTLTLTGSGSYAGAISGGGGLDFNGGTFTLSGNNSYSGTTTVDGGSLIVANASGLGSTAGGTVVNSGASLTISGVNIGNENVTLNDATLSGSGGAAMTGAVTLGAGTTNVINSIGGGFNLGGAIDGLASLTLQGTNLTLSANIGSGTPLAALAVNTLLNLGGNTALSAAAIGVNNGVAGGNSLAMNGTSLSLSGPLAVNNLSFTGTGVINTLLFNTGSAQTFNVTGVDTGNIANAGIGGGGSFANVQNITGTGSASNSFIFADNTRITGVIDGGSTVNTNTLDYSAYVSPVTITLAANKFNGTTVGNSITITNYTNFNTLVGNGAGSQLIMTSAQQAQAVSTGALSGYIGDPVFWSNMTGIFSTAPASSSPPSINVASIVQQPQVNSTDTSSSSSTSTYTAETTTVDQNVDTVQSDADTMFDTMLSDIKINPYCYQAATN